MNQSINFINSVTFIKFMIGLFLIAKNWINMAFTMALLMEKYLYSFVKFLIMYCPIQKCNKVSVFVLRAAVIGKNCNFIYLVSNNFFKIIQKTRNNCISVFSLTTTFPFRKQIISSQSGLFILYTKHWSYLFFGEIKWLRIRINMG